MRHTRGLEERLFRDNFERRTKIFDSLVGGVMSYGAEIWGWAEILALEKVQRAIKYEERILKSRENGIVRECIKERKGKGDKEKLKEKQTFLHNCEYSQQGLEQLSATGANVGEPLRSREKELQGQVQFNKLWETRYNVKSKKFDNGRITKKPQRVK